MCSFGLCLYHSNDNAMNEDFDTGEWDKVLSYFLLIIIIAAIVMVQLGIINL